MNFDLETVIKALQFALTIGVGIYAFFINRRKDVDTRFQSGAKRMDTHGQRISALEQTVKALPTKDVLHTLELQMAQQTGEMKEIRAVLVGNQEIMRRLEGQLSRHEDHLRENSR